MSTKTHSNLKAVHILRFITAVLLAGFLLSCEGYESVIEDLSQRDAHIALVLLRDKNIEAYKEGRASKKNVTYHIKVKKNQAEKALRLLVNNHIPREERARLKDVYPPGSSGLIPSKSDELARLIMALQGESEALLKVIPGIVDARVMFSVEPPQDYKSTNPKRTASVAIVYQPSSSNLLPPLLDQEIQQLMAASISGLLPEDVAVVQKALQPLVYVDSPTSTQAGASIVPQHDSRFQWWLMLLTVLALLVASYGVLRLIMQRRSSSL